MIKQAAGFLKMKQSNEKVVRLTAYDYPSAKLAKQGDVDVNLVSDSLGMVILVTIQQSLLHSKT